MRVRVCIAVALAVGVVGTSNFARSTDAFRKLGIAAIKVAGMETTDDIHWAEQYMPDGTYRAWIMSKP